ncbi:MAG: FAD-dependent oxidoreductase, partial [Pseudomonadota bacterium]
MAEQFDVAVIGSGPGGYVCAIKAAQLGLSVAIVEKMPTLGGTCLNIGCIPSKALLHASEMYHEAEHGFDALGIQTGTVKLDLKKMMAHKDDTVKANVDGVAYLMKKNKVTVFHGMGSLADANTVLVTADDGGESKVSAKNIVIATGSDVAGIPGVDVTFDDKTIVSSTEALSLSAVPKTMVIVGGGVI